MKEAKRLRSTLISFHLTNILLQQLFSLRERPTSIRYRVTFAGGLLLYLTPFLFSSLLSWGIKQNCLFGPNRLVYPDSMCPIAIHIYKLLSSTSSSKRGALPDVVAQENKTIYTSSSTSSPWCRTSLSTNW